MDIIITPEQADIIFTKLGFCCGDPDSVFNLIKEILLFAEGDQGVGFCPRLLDLPQGITYAILYWLEACDLLDHGGVCLCGWISEKGRWFLNYLKTCSSYDEHQQRCIDSALEE